MHATGSSANHTAVSARLPTGESIAPAALVDDVSTLVSPPDVCMRIFELLQSPDSTAREIGEVIVQDPNLTARLLKIVNSPFYNFSRRVDTVSRAIAIVGSRDLSNLVIAISAVRSFSNIANDLVNMDTFWRHSLFTALIARALSKQCRILHPERLFIAGLLHDIGALVLYNRMPEAMRDLLLVAGGDEGALHRAETETLGFGHPDLGGLLLELWRIPQALQDAVRFHHCPLAAPTSALVEASIVQTAELLANFSEIGGFCEESGPGVLPEAAAWQALGMDPEAVDVEAIISAAGVEFTHTAGLLISG